MDWLDRYEAKGRKAYDLSEPGDTLSKWLEASGTKEGEPEREAFERGWHQAEAGSR